MLRCLGLTLLLATGCTAPAAPDTLAPTTVQSSGQEVGTDANDDRPSAPVEEANMVALAFAQAWTRRSTNKDTWWAETALWCDEDLARSLRSTDPANVPATTVLGPPITVGGPVEEGLRLDVPTDTGTLRLTLGSLGGTWKVTGIDFARSTR